MGAMGVMGAMGGLVLVLVLAYCDSFLVEGFVGLKGTGLEMKLDWIGMDWTNSLD